MFTSIYKAIIKLFCGPSESKPSQPQEQQYPQQYPQKQQYTQQPQQQQPSNGQKPSSPYRPTKHQSDESYVELRARANGEGDAMAKSFEQSRQAYARGDKAEAKILSNRGKEHQQKMETLNKQASDWIFIENNKDSKPGELDLHGLYVKEAIARTDQAIQEAKQRGDSGLQLIVGKGLHSTNGSKIRPAVEELMQKHRLVAELDPQNAGVLNVQINKNGDKGVGSDEIARRIERSDEGCTIM